MKPLHFVNFMPYTDPVVERDMKRASAHRRYLADPQGTLLRNRKWAAANPDKVREQKKRWRAANLDHVQNQNRGYRLWKAFRLTLEAWTAMFTAQGSQCAACGAMEPGSGWWHTDHDPRYPVGHERHIRGILCHRCNLRAAAGSSADIMALRALADWLETKL